MERFFYYTKSKTHTSLTAILELFLIELAVQLKNIKQSCPTLECRIHQSDSFFSFSILTYRTENESAPCEIILHSKQCFFMKGIYEERLYCRNTFSAALAWAAFNGSKKVKRLPLPSTLSTQILPPCFSIMSLAIASPNPRPPCLRVRCFSTW